MDALIEKIFTELLALTQLTYKDIAFLLVASLIQAAIPLPG